MTDPQSAQSPPTYPDPLTDAVSAAATQLFGGLTFAGSAAEILARLRAEKVGPNHAAIEQEPAEGRSPAGRARGAAYPDMRFRPTRPTLDGVTPTIAPPSHPPQARAARPRH